MTKNKFTDKEQESLMKNCLLITSCAMDMRKITRTDTELGEAILEIFEALKKFSKLMADKSDE